MLFSASSAKPLRPLRYSVPPALRESLERQAELEQQRRMVIGAIAHDLRTLLFSLRGYLEGLDLGLANTPERAAHYLAVCRQQADALERLVADLFTYTRLDYLEEVPRREPLELGALLAAAVESVRPTCPTSSIRCIAATPHATAALAVRGWDSPSRGASCGRTAATSRRRTVPAAAPS